MSFASRRWGGRATVAAVGSLLTLATVVRTASAQEREETLINRRVSSGGFGGPVVKATQVHGEFALMNGGSGGWIINHQFIVGGAAYDLVQQGIRTSFTPSAGTHPELEMSYGGLELQYIHRWSRVSHLTISMLSGGGRVSYQGYKDTAGLSDDFAVVEPGAGLELNVTPWLRVVTGASYRFIEGANIPAVTGRDLSGVAGTLAFKFGKF